jgi:cobalt-precorrin 5A hydrolase
VRGAVFAFTERGKTTARRVADHLDGEIDLYAPPRLAGEGFATYEGSLPGFVGGLFDREALIFVGAAGIALRAVAPYVASKKSDPAVLCMDEAARYVIPLLSGHIGGANALARRLAAALDAIPIITTATDVNGRFSVDAWATEQGMAITSMVLAKRVSAEILVRDIPFWSEADRPDTLAGGLVWSDSGELGICASVHDVKPFANTLLLVPRVLHIGVGCRRGTPAEAIEAAILKILAEYKLRPEAVARVASIDVKANEAGLLECCRSHGWPIRFYSAAQLNAVQGSFSKSEFVKNTVGVDNVCERAAAASGGEIIVKKTAMNGVTAAVAEMKWGIEFG